MWTRSQLFGKSSTFIFSFSILQFKKRLSRLKQNARSKVQNSFQKFKENFQKAKNQQRSKRKSLFLGFTTVRGIFGIRLFAPVLPAIAKAIPNKAPSSKGFCPAPSAQPASSQQIIAGLSGAATTICALAVSSGSFILGVVCGVIVVVGILKIQGQ